MRKHSRGVSLASILLCLSVLVAVLFLVTSASLSHLNLVTSIGQGQHATNLAEAALARALEQSIVSDYDFGKQTSDRVEVTIAGLDDAEGIVTFNPGEFPQGYSTYNLDDDASKLGSGGMNLPPASIHFVARGRVGDTVRWMECVFHKPPYPDGLVASGAVRASGLTLLGVRQAENYVGGNPLDVDPEDQTLANLFANGTGVSSGDPAIVLEENCEIHGSVGSPGAIEIDPGNVIRGEVSPGSEPRPIPSLDIPNRIAILQENSVSVTSTGGNLILDDGWFNHSAGSLLVNGDLDLNGSALTVNGNLRVNGAVKGVGLILVDGDVEIRDGGSAVVGTDQIAVAATGNVSLSAATMEGNYFQGLVYTEGDMSASDITVVGTVVSNGRAGRPGDVELDNVRFVRTPTSVEVGFTAMRGFGYGGRSTAISLTLTRAPDGETYVADARVAFTIDSDASDPDNVHNPQEWAGYGDGAHYRTFKGVNVGKPGPDFGKPLIDQIAAWIDPLDDENSLADWTTRYNAIMDSELDGLVNSTPETFEVFTGLNNLLSEQFGESRVLIQRPFVPSNS